MMPFSAAGSALGYLFQCRYALLGSLRRLRKSDVFAVSLETIDDVVFETEGEAYELLQLKHHISRTADLTDASTDLWKSIRIWCEAVKDGTVVNDSTFILITTALVSEGSTAYYLKAEGSRDIDEAIRRLNATAESSTNQTNAPAYASFLSLNADQKKRLIDAIIIIDSAPSIVNLDSLLREEVRFSVKEIFLESFLQRLEGWWFRRAIKHLALNDSKLILSEELRAEVDDLREQFKQECLPIDDDILSAAVDASGYQDKIFVHQLRMIEIGNGRIFHAIRNYFRAFEQRSRWIREDLLLVGELDRYEDRLIEEWDLLFQGMLDELGDMAIEEEKRKKAQALYKWVETGMHPCIRLGVTAPYIARGTYQILADNGRVGWHPEFARRLKQLLEQQEVR